MCTKLFISSLYKATAQLGASHSSAGIVTRLWAGQRKRSPPSAPPPQEEEGLLFSKDSSPFLGPTHFPIEWVSGNLSPEVKPPGGDAYSPRVSSVLEGLYLVVKHFLKRSLVRTIPTFLRVGLTRAVLLRNVPTTSQPGRLKFYIL